MLRKRGRRHTVVEIVWRDSTSYGAGWFTNEELRYKGSAVLFTIGFLVAETENDFVVAHTVDNVPDAERNAGHLFIPKSSVVRIRRRAGWLSSSDGTFTLK